MIKLLSTALLMGSCTHRWGLMCAVMTSYGCTRPAECRCRLKGSAITPTHLVVTCDLHSPTSAKLPHAGKHNGKGAMNQTRAHCVTDMKLLHRSLSRINEVSE